MPTFSIVKSETTADIDFEVFCARCGAGLCNNADTRTSRSRNYPQVTIEPCDRCLDNYAEKQCDKVRDELNEQIENLKEEIARFQQAIG